MRIIRGFEILHRYQPPCRRLALAWWHSPHSLTWRWAVDMSWGLTWRASVGGYRNPNGSGYWHVWLFVVGLNGRWQRPMWFRDLYMRMRDEEDIRSGLMWVSEKHPLHRLMPSPPPPKATVAGPEIIQ